MRIRVTMLSGLLTLSAALSAGAVLAAARTGAPTPPTWQGTILCTAKIASGHHSFAVDKSGRLVGLMLRRAVTPGLRVQLQEPHWSKDRRSLAARDVSTVRLLGPTTGPVVVRAELIEDGYSRYRFYRHGRPWGCPVTFGEAAAVSVAQLILSGRSAQITLVVRERRLVHLRPQRRPLAEPARHAQATADAEDFVALLARGDSIAACSTVSREVLLIHGGRDGCLMAFESAKFVYRDHYADAAVTRVALFALGGRSYALATIARHIGNTRAILILERGKYRYLGDFSLSPIELW
jgi:hypothetical protein